MQTRKFLTGKGSHATILPDFGCGVGKRAYASPNTNERKTIMPLEVNEAIIAYEKEHSVRIDYAKPQGWFDAVLNAGLSINPQDYVWVYTKDSGMFGKPLHKDTIIADYYVRKELAI